jgi:hypothetical protein
VERGEVPLKWQQAVHAARKLPRQQKAAMLAESRAHWANSFFLGAVAASEWIVFPVVFSGFPVSISAAVLLIGGFFYGMAWATWRYPSVLNLPNREAYRSLLEADQREVIERHVGPFFYWTALIWMVAGAFLIGVAGTEGIEEDLALAAVLIGHLLAAAADGGLAIYFLFIRAQEEVDRLRKG